MAMFELNPRIPISILKCPFIMVSYELSCLEETFPILHFFNSQTLLLIIVRILVGED